MNSQPPNDNQLLSEALKKILSDVNEYTFVKDKNFVYQAASEAFAKMCGQKCAADILGKTDYDLFPKDIADAYRADDQKMMNTGKALSSYIEKLPDKDGHPCWSKTWKNLIKNHHGQIIGMYGRGIDVTKEIGMEAELVTAHHYQTLINSVPDGLGIQHEGNGLFILDFYNDAWCRAHHFSPEYAKKLLHKNTQDFIYPPDLEEVKQEFKRVQSGAKHEGHSIYRIYGEDKQLHWIEIRYRSAYENNGILYYYASYVNLDAQKAAENKLAESRMALKEAVSHSEIQFFTYFPDRHRCEIYVTSAHLKELPMVWDNFPDDFLTYTKSSPEDAAAYRKMLQQVVDGADSSECLVCFDYKGTRNWEEMHLNAIRDDTGRLIKAQGYSLNLTKKKLQEKIALDLEAAKQASLAKSEFLSRMSHDIRTPINGIIGMTYLTQDMKLPKEAHENLAKISTSSKFLLSLINDVLDMTKAESGKVNLHPEPYPADEFHAYIDSVFGPLCKRRNQTLIFEIPDFINDLVPVFDKLRINQVVFNLLSNASKYTPEGGKIIYRVREKRLHNKRMHMHIDVIDNGMGMSEAFQKIVFEPFAREDRNYITEMQGTGLGMSIVKKLVDIMNGTIKVKSKIDEGTTYSLDFDLDCVPVGEIHTTQESGHVSDGDNTKLQGKHVLICEDHPLNRKIIDALLQKPGMLVTNAENGLEGLKIFTNAPINYFDVVVMDIRMPVMDGYEATREIRALNRSDAVTTPIIGLSANAFSEDMKKAKAAGMSDYLAKPVNPPALYATLRKYVK